MHVQIGIKQCVMNKDSYILWHYRLGHISIAMIKRLVNDGVLSTLNFTDLILVWTTLKVNKTTSPRKVSRGVQLY